tara:strand:+ start:11887 stop:12321 length:435 start_codon:yes stop_codon:yes gene_type:complete
MLNQSDLKLIDDTLRNLDHNRNLILSIATKSNLTQSIIADYIKMRSCESLNLKTERLNKKDEKKSDYISARHICFYLIHKYSQFTDETISVLYFNEFKRAAITKGRNKIKDIVANPKINMLVYERYQKVLNSIQEFIQITKNQK